MVSRLALSGFPPNTGHFFEDRVKHPRDLDVDAEEGFTEHDRGVVDARCRVANERVICRVLQGHRVQVGRW